MGQSKLNDRALLDPNGSVFMPATVENARMLYERYGARPADPERFPWRCPEAETFIEGIDWGGAAPRQHLQCCLVDGHVGDHAAEVGW